MVHCHPDVERSVAITQDGISYGGDVDHIASLIAAGEAAATDFLCLKGWCSWLPGEMEGYVQQGYWLPVEHSSVPVLLGDASFRFDSETTSTPGEEIGEDGPQMPLRVRPRRGASLASLPGF